MTAPKIENRTIAKKLLVSSAAYLFLLIIIAAFIFANPIYNNKITYSQKITGGTVDFSANPEGINQIQGEWSFWWKSLITEVDSAGQTGFCVLPGSWENAGITESFGYASFGLKVSGLDPEKMYALRVGHTLSACRIVINGKTIRSIGTPGRTLAEEVPNWNSVLARFTPRSDGTADIILQISNHYDRIGGSNASLYVGESSLMNKMEDSQRLTECFVFSVLAIMGLFFLTLFLFRHKEMPFLWFAAICMIVGFRTLCYDGFALLDLIPSLSWLAFFKIGYLTFPLVMICFIGFLLSIFPTIVKKWHFLTFLIIFATYSLIICFAPVYISALLLIPFQIFGLVAVGYGIVSIIRACVHQLEGGRWLLVGFSVASGTFIYDVLVSMWIISGISLSYLGMSFCLFCLALMVIERYSSSFVKARVMSEQLKVLNKSLRRFVPAEFLSFLGKDSLADVNPGDNVEVEMAILSADIRAFTTMAEKMTPDEVFAYLNEYLKMVGPIVRSNGGFIAKYEGDGFFALFPLGAEAAVLCAVQIQSAIGSRNALETSKKPIVVGIGIDAGKLTLGTVGDNFRMDGAVISHCVACAARLEAATKVYHARILINGSVFSGISDPLSYSVRPVDCIEVAGKTSFLFEVYNNDEEEIRALKWKTQADFEHAVFAYFSGKIEDSKDYISRVLAVNPTDTVALEYKRRCEV